MKLFVVVEPSSSFDMSTSCRRRQCRLMLLQASSSSSASSLSSRVTAAAFEGSDRPATGQTGNGTSAEDLENMDDERLSNGAKSHRQQQQQQQPTATNEQQNLARCRRDVRSRNRWTVGLSTTVVHYCRIHLLLAAIDAFAVALTGECVGARARVYYSSNCL
jgi:hypothetical protein